MATNPDTDLTSVHDVQVARLDADMFNADDIDGGTEGLVGSGNLNYLVLQSQQTNEQGQNNDPFAIHDNQYNPDAMGIFPGANPLGDGGDNRAINPSDFSNSSELPSGFINTATVHNNESLLSNGESSNFNSISAINTATATHVSSSQSNSETINNRFPGDNGLNGLDGGNGLNGTGLNGTNGIGLNGTNGSGTNGRNGVDGVSPPPPPPPVDVDSHIGVHVLSDILNANLDVLANPIGDLVGGVNIDVTGTLGDILSPNDGLLPHPGAIIDGIIGDNHLIDQLQAGPLLDGTESLADGVVGQINPILTNALPFVPDILNTAGNLLNQLNGDSGLFVTSNIKLPALGELGGLGNLALHVPLTPVESITGPINLHLNADTDQTRLLTDRLELQPIDIGLVSTGDVLNGINTGITTGDLLGSTGQAVQDIVGGLTNGGNILDNVIPHTDQIPSNLVNTVTDLASPVTGIVDNIVQGNIANPGNLIDTLNGNGGGSGGDSDVTLNTSIPVLDNALGQPGLNVTLDPVENIVGDVDLGLNAHTDAVNNLLAGDLPGTVQSVVNTATNLVDLNLNPFQPEAGQNAPIGASLGSETQTGADQDLGIQTGIGNLNLGAGLDPVENLVGDVDLNVNTGTDAVNQLLAGNLPGTVDSLINTTNNAINLDISLLNPEPAQNDGLGLSIADNHLSVPDILAPVSAAIPSWPEATIGGAADMLSGVTAPLQATLPEPTGLLSDGMNLISDSTGSGSALGGVLGNHHGGLFG